MDTIFKCEFYKYNFSYFIFGFYKAGMIFAYIFVVYRCTMNWDKAVLLHENSQQL